MHSPSVARLHLSESSYGVSPAARRAYLDHVELLSVYPDPRRKAVSAAVAKYLGVDPGGVLVANGSDELVLLTALALGDRDKPGVTTRGTFPGYRICLEEVRRGVIAVDSELGRPDVDAFCAALAQAGVGYLCNPHNPSGRALTAPELATVMEASRVTGTPVVFDEAYIEFAPAGTPSVLDYLPGYAPVVGLRTFSKAWGLSALRIGYAFGDPEVVGSVRTAQGTMPFSSNAVAQAAVRAALEDPGFVADVRRRNQARVDWFARRLDEGAIGYLPTTTNFVALRLPDPAAAEKRLAERGVLTRDAGVFGMPGYLRVSMGSEDELDRLLAALLDLGMTGAAMDHADVTSSPRQ